MKHQESDLANRLSYLENQNRLFKRCAAVCFVLAVVVTSGGAYKYVADYGKQADNTIHAQHAVIVKNSFDQDRISISHTLDGTWIEMKDLDGVTRVKFGIDDNGDGRFRLLRNDGTPVKNFRF